MIDKFEKIVYTVGAIGAFFILLTSILIVLAMTKVASFTFVIGMLCILTFSLSDC